MEQPEHKKWLILYGKSISPKQITSDEVIRQETTILSDINEDGCSFTEHTTISAKFLLCVYCRGASEEASFGTPPITK